MALAIAAMRAFLPIPWLAQAVVAGVVYLAAIFLLKTLSQSEMEFGKRFLTLSNLKGSFVPEKGSST